MFGNAKGLTRTQAALLIVGGFGGILFLLTAVVYYLTELEKQRQLTQETIKPEIQLTVALKEVANDMPFFFAQKQFFPKEFLAVTLKETASEEETVQALESGEAQMAVVDVDRLLGHNRLRIVAPISYIYLCGNAGDPAIAAATDLKQLTSHKLVTNLPEGGFYDKYLRHQLAGQTIARIEIKDTNQVEWRAVIRQPAGEVFFGAQPYCSQYEKYNFETRKDDKGVVFSMRAALDLQKAKPPARVLVTTADFIKQNGEAVFRTRAGLKAAAELVYKVPTKLESATFYRYHGRTSPQGYSLAFDWEMAYRVARVLVERDLYPKPDEIDTIDTAALKTVLQAIGEQVDDNAVTAMLIDKELDQAIANTHAEAEKTYTIRYLSEEEVQEKRRIAEAEAEEGAEWEREFEISGEAKPIQRIYTDTITDELYGVYFLNPQRGWIVGYYGTILATTDGGKTFHPQKSGVTELLKAVYFVDENQGWVAGVEGVILHTEDGGKTWVRQKSGTEEYLRDIVFTDAQHGLAVARTSVLLRTQDGGATWIPGRLGAGGGGEDRINRIRFFNGTAWAVGEFGDIFVSRDQGATWEQKTSGLKITLTDIAFADARNGLITGLAGLVLHTADGGESWQPVATGSKNNLFGTVMLSADEAVVTGDLSLLRLARTNGAWTVTPAPIEGLDLERQGSWLYTLARTDGAVWGVGMRGTVVVSTEQGAQWRVAPLKIEQRG
ncbi:MAG: YCF48-related protein [Candidatus Binatia bacterium]